MLENTEKREATYKELMNTFSAETGLPIGLFEVNNNTNQEVLIEPSRKHNEEFCNIIQSYPEGELRCKQDQCMRARIAYEGASDEPVLCHAGLFNQMAPIIRGDEVVAVLLYGEMRISGHNYNHESKQKVQEAIKHLGLNDDQEHKLRVAYGRTKILSIDEINIYKKLLPGIAMLFLENVKYDDAIYSNIVNTTHELLIRVQGVLARAENLFLGMNELKPKEQRAELNEIVNAAEAFKTVIYNLADPQSGFRQEKIHLKSLLTTSKTIYSEEAKSRKIKVTISLRPIDGRDPVIYGSKESLKLIFNNLVQNAIKYSFRGNEVKAKEVRIYSGKVEKYYAIAIENYGVGITDDEIRTRSIFLDGVQGSLTLGEYRTGTGKGLFIAEREARMHGGRIEVESKLMGKTDLRGQPYLNIFTVYLPIENQ